MGDVIDIFTEKKFKQLESIPLAADTINIELSRNADKGISYRIYSDYTDEPLPLWKIQNMVGSFSFHFMADDVENPICRFSIFKKDYAEDNNDAHLRVEFADVVNFDKWSDRWWLFKTLVIMYFSITRGEYETR